MDVGSELTAILTDGARITGKLTFGDIARAELQTQTNFMQRFRDQDSIMVSDLAVLTFQIAQRQGVFAGDFNQWLMQLDSFDMEDESEDTPDPTATNGNGGGATVSPFPTEAQADC